MRDCQSTDAAQPDGSGESKIAKVLARGGCGAGDYVTLLHVVKELPSFFWCGGIGIGHPDQPVRVTLLPNKGGVPLRVRSICLPFILVKTPSGELRNLDVRRHRLARLDRGHALVAWKACKQSRQKRIRT